MKSYDLCLGHVVAIATKMSTQRGHDLPHKVQSRIMHYMKGNVALFHKMLNLTMSPGPMDKSDKGKLTIGGIQLPHKVQG